MRNVAGIVLILAGLGFVLAGLRHRARGAPPSKRMQRMGETLRPIVWFALGYTGLKAVLVWAAFDAGRYVAPLDLAGFLVLLASYGTWLTLRTRPRRRPIAEQDRAEPRASEADGGRMPAEARPARIADGGQGPVSDVGGSPIATARCLPRTARSGDTPWAPISSSPS